ncbi:hypothetical protein [Histidinibacterium aquaticum]|uniref:Uncharacterized protein n=1 Tax=Histidinibacterium aquaticum TaxID=2613962 RepID=A0A5J5GSN1_9RHOB|nr:hypothetical protein [Histidinibacterium aquaticum]KAA9010382.1 hypothetical protein F3S47_03820 [Histidinibacterium aquaticum]
MHPPFFVAAEPARPTRSGPRPARSVTRRGSSERLTFALPPEADPPPRPLEPPVSLAALARSAPPRRARTPDLRERIGRWLIRLGERIADPARPA